MIFVFVKYNLCMNNFKSNYFRSMLNFAIILNHFLPFIRYYLPTPPLGQDMTQGQFLSGV